MNKVTDKTRKVRKLITLGKTNEKIMKAVPKVTLQQIYQHRYLMKKEVNRAIWASDWPHPERLKKMEVTPQEDEAMNKIANDTQIGGTHYMEKELQPWDAILAWGCGFLDGNVIKYVVRYRSKGGVEDLKKAQHYLAKLIELEAKVTA